MAAQGPLLSGLARDKCQVPRVLGNWSSHPQPKAWDFLRQARCCVICSLDPPRARLRARLRPTADLLTPHPHARLCWAHCRRFLAESLGWLLSVLLLQKKKLTHRDIKWPDPGRTALSRPPEKVGHQQWGAQVSNCPFLAWLGWTPSDGGSLSLARTPDECSFRAGVVSLSLLTGASAQFRGLTVP